MLIGHMLIKIFAILKSNNNNNDDDNNNHSKNGKSNFYTHRGSAHATESKRK